MKKNIFLNFCVLLAVVVFAANTANAQTKQGYAELSSDRTTLTFKYGEMPSSGSFAEVYTIESGGWLDLDKGTITTVVFDPSFKVVRPTSCGWWFSNFTDLTTIIGIENLRTSEATNLSFMFYNCYALENLDMTHFQTGQVTDMSYMFANCSKLTSLDLSLFYTSKVTTMENMFYGCSSLKTIKVGSLWITDNVENSSNMLYGCSELIGGEGTPFSPDYIDKTYARIDGKNGSTGYFTVGSEPYAELSSDGTTLTFQYGVMPYNSSRFYALETGKWLELDNKSPITNVVFDKSFSAAVPLSCSWWFSNFTGLTTITGLEYLNTSEVTNMQYMFLSCRSLTSLDLTHFYTPNLTDTESMFSGCYNLKTIKVGCGWNVDMVTASDNMFADCDQLKGDNGTSYSSANTDKTYARVDASGTPGYLTAGIEPYVVLSSDGTTLTFKYGLVPTDDISVYNLASGDWLDLGKGSITDVVFDETFKDVRPTSCGWWFSNFVGLTTITGIENLNISQVKNMSYMFFNCWALPSIDLRHFNTANVEDMQCMFYNCTGLKTIKVGSGWNTDAVTNSYDMFYNCAELVGGNGTTYSSAHTDKTYARMDGGSTSETPGYLTDGRVPYVELSSDLTTLTFKYGDEIPTTGTFYAVYDLAGGGWLDNDKSSIIEVVFDESFKDARPLYCSYWFSDFISITTITGIEYLNTSEAINLNFMFKNCFRLTSIDVSNFNTEKVENMPYMFSGCTGLTALDLTNFSTASVEDMESMFNGCTSLKTIKVGSGWNTDAVTNSSNMFTDCSVLVGGNGTTYTSAHTDKTYARIDGGSTSETPGYLSDGRVPYVELSSDLKTLTFKYGDEKPTTGTFYAVYDLGGGDWMTDANKGTVTKVVFDESFKDARPGYCSYWFFDFQYITTITGIEYLNTSEAINLSCMFTNCKGLTSLDVSNFNTEKVEEMDCMFSGCIGLTALDLTNFSTASVKNMEKMFNGCTGLKTIKVGSGWNTDAVTNSSNMFTDCSVLVGGKGTTYTSAHTDKTYARMDGGPTSETPGYLTDGRVPYAELSSDGKTLTFKYGDKKPEGAYDLNTGNTDPAWYSEKANITNVVFEESFKDARPTSCYSWFERMENLTSIDGIQYLNTSSVTTMKFMFLNCSGLTSLDVSNFNTEKVEEMAYMFYGCSGLNSLDVSDFNTENVTNMRSMFYDCSGLTSLDVSNFNTEKVEEMAYMFYGCTGLTILDFTNFNTVNVKDMESMFYGCSGLKTIKVGNGWNVDNVEKSSNMFDGCSVLVGGNGTTPSSEHTDKTYARMDGGSTSETPGYLTDGRVPYVELSSDGTTLTFKYGDKKPTTGTIYDLNTGSNTPDWCISDNKNSVTTVVFDESFKDARPTSCYEWFYEFSQLTTITDIQYLNTSAVETMEKMFYGCSGLNSLDVSDFNTENVTNMRSMFYGCSGLTSLDVSNFNTEKVEDMAYMFYGCSGLTILDFTNFNTANVKDMESMFYDCSDLEKIKVGNGWNVDNVEKSSNMFYGCIKLIGGNGTAYEASHTDKTYAVLNGEHSYLTDGRVAFAELSADGKTLTFKYENKKPDDAFGLNRVQERPGWYDDAPNITAVVFESSFAAARPTSCYNWFANMYELESITGMKEYLKTDDVTDMESMFTDCQKLESIDFSSFNTAKVENMKNMFVHFPLKTLDLSSFNTSSVKNMTNMFYGSSNLTTIIVGEGWKTGSVTTSTDMFKNCSALIGNGGAWVGSSKDKTNANTLSTGYLTSGNYKVFLDPDGGTLTDGTVFEPPVTLPTPAKEGHPFLGWVRQLTSATYESSTSTTVTVAENDGNRWYKAQWAVVQPYVVLSDDSKTLTFKYGYKPNTGTVYDLNTGTNTPDWCIPDNKNSITEVVFDESFQEASPTSCYEWFYGFSQLTTITDIQYLNTSAVETMKNMFYECGGLTSLDLSNFNTTGVLDMAYMFYECNSLKTIKVDTGWDTGSVGESSNMFDGCSVLVGGKGTVYSSGNIDKTYACIDWPGAPGYFTGIEYSINLPDNWTAYAANDQNTAITTAPAGKEIVVKYGGATPIKKVLVFPMPQGITITNTSPLTMSADETVQLTYTVTPDGVLDEDKEAVAWTSSKETVAIVSTDGRVVAKGSGEASITATLNGKSATITIIVQ